MKIRIAHILDAAGIAEVETVTWAATYRGLIPESVFAQRTLENRTKYWTSSLSDTSGERLTVVVAEDSSGKVVGFCDGGRPIHPFQGYDAEVIGLYVFPEYQREGLGRSLFRRVAEELEKQDCHALVVRTLRDSQYRTFYEKLGGVHLGEESLDFGEPVITAVYGWPQIAHLSRMKA